MTRHRLLFPVLLLVSAPTALFAQAEESADMAMEEGQARMVMVSADEIEYAPLEVPGFDSGMELAVLSGDPSSESAYVLRLTFPDGYRFPAHWHPKTENLTVIQGTLLLGMGETVDDESLVAYTPGDFLHIPAKNAHFGGATGWTEIQLHGIGPFEIKLVE